MPHRSRRSRASWTSPTAPRPTHGAGVVAVLRGVGATAVKVERRCRCRRGRRAPRRRGRCGRGRRSRRALEVRVPVADEIDDPRERGRVARVEPPLQPRGRGSPVTSATFPAPAAMLIGSVSVTSAGGSATPFAPPEASCTSTYWPRACRDRRQLGRLGAVRAEVPVPSRSRTGASRRRGRRTRSAIEDLDEVVREGRAGVPAASVHLADDEVRAHGARQLDEQDEDDQGQRAQQARRRGLRQRWHVLSPS